MQTPYGGTTESPSGQAPITDQAGELDNRLDLQVGDYPQIKDWEDGKRYRITMDVEQVSPGKFAPITLISAKPAEDTEQSAPAREGEEADEPQTGNPAVAELMRGMRGGGS